MAYAGKVERRFSVARAKGGGGKGLGWAAGVGGLHGVGGYRGVPEGVGGEVTWADGAFGSSSGLQSRLAVWSRWEQGGGSRK